MGRSAPGFSLAAQLREERAKLRRLARKEVERIEREIAQEKKDHAERIRTLEQNLADAKVAYNNLNDQLKGKLQVELPGPAEPPPEPHV